MIRQRLETQTGSILTNHNITNAKEFTKIIAQAILSNCKHLIIGFISRKAQNDASKHEILMTKSYTINEAINTFLY